MTIKALVTIHGVKVDSVCSTMWKAHEGGVKDISRTPDGVLINWNFGRTFVPYSNIRYMELV
jgi:hypothetical protein